MNSQNGIPLAGHVTVTQTDDNRCSIIFDCITPEDEGEYLCKATNEHGMATTWAELIVESKPEDIVGGTNLSVPTSKVISSPSLLDSDISKLVFLSSSSLPLSPSSPPHPQRTSAMTSESAATLSFLGDLVSLGSSSV